MAYIHTYIHTYIHNSQQAPESTRCVPDPFLPLGVGSGDKTMCTSNALFVRIIFSESHTPGIQKLTNKSAHGKQLIMGMVSNAC